MYDLLKVLVANLLMLLPVSLGLAFLGLLVLRWRRLGARFTALGGGAPEW